MMSISLLGVQTVWCKSICFEPARTRKICWPMRGAIPEVRSNACLAVAEANWVVALNRDGQAHIWAVTTMVVDSVLAIPVD